MLQDRISNPASLDQLKTSARSNVNRSFDQLQTNTQDRLVSQGFGRSGKLAMNTQRNELARGGALGNLESQFAGLQVDQNNQAIQDAFRFAFSSPTTTQTLPGNVAGGIAGSGLDALIGLMGMNARLGQSGGSIADLWGGLFG